MNKEEFEKLYNVRLKSKQDIWYMRFIGFFARKFMTDFWTTYRLPGQLPTITYPKHTVDPMMLGYLSIREHELIHCEDIRTFWGLIKTILFVFAIPLPIIFSGRWFVERHAYLHGILHHNYDMNKVVELLWGSYLWAWPKPLMKRWFKKKIDEHNKGV